MSDKNFIVKNGVELGGTVNTVLTADNSGGLLVGGNAVGLPALTGPITITFSDYVEGSFVVYVESPLSIEGLSVATLNTIANGTNFTISNNSEGEGLITTVFTKTDDAYDLEGTKVPVTYVSGNSTIESFSTTWTIVGTGSAANKFLTNNGTIASWATVPVPNNATSTTAGIVYGKTDMLGLTALGQYAANDLSAVNMTAIGHSAAQYMYAGTQNVAIGRYAMRQNNDSSSNTAVGDGAMLGNSQIGNYNVAIGTDTMPNLYTGQNNTAVGAYSAENMSGGSGNTLVGRGAGATITTGSNNILLGAYAAATSASTDGEIVLGTANQNRVRIPGISVDWFNRGPGMTLISSTTLSGASIALTSISNQFTDLRLVIRNYRPATDATNLRMRFNNNATTIYKNNVDITGNGAFDTDAFVLISSVDNGASTGLIIVDIPDYVNSVTWKIAENYSIANDATTPTNFRCNFGQGLYGSTTAISRIDLLPGAGNFTSGTVLLYGVK